MHVMLSVMITRSEGVGEGIKIAEPIIAQQMSFNCFDIYLIGDV